MRAPQTAVMSLALLGAMTAGHLSRAADETAMPPPVRPPSCEFRAGARVAQTLGIDAATRAALPISNVVVLMQENRSFDHYFGRLSAFGQPDAEGFPADFVNPDQYGQDIAPFHLRTTCVPRDPPHQWQAMRAQWNGGSMNGFVTSASAVDHDGRWAMGYYEESDLPFYYWLARTFAIGDRHFAATLGGTWPNRQFLYAGTSQTWKSSTGMLSNATTIFDLLNRRGVGWRVYTDGPPRQDCIGWRTGAPGVDKSAAFFAALRDGDLPPVSFLDAGVEDEHPPADIQRGERWARLIYEEATRSPLWPGLAILFTYDEGGGFFDHVPPPRACPPDPAHALLDRRGARVPLMVISPWAAPHHVSHVERDHASVLRFIELLHDLPALSARDANADALLDLFDFTQPHFLTAPPAPAAGVRGCRPIALARR